MIKRSEVEKVEGSGLGVVSTLCEYLKGQKRHADMGGGLANERTL